MDGIPSKVFVMQISLICRIHFTNTNGQLPLDLQTQNESNSQIRDFAKYFTIFVRFNEFYEYGYCRDKFPYFARKHLSLLSRLNGRHLQKMQKAIFFIDLSIR